VWRSRLRGLTVVFLLEEVRHHLRLPFAFSRFEHGPDQETDHVVEKPVGLDVENEPTLSLTPGGMGDAAAVIVSIGSRAFDSERPEAMVAFDGSSGGLEARKIERFLPDQLVGPAKRGRCEIVCAYVVAVAAGYCTIARVELVTHFEGCRNPYIVR
jgi:hypothetical protein